MTTPSPRSFDLDVVRTQVRSVLSLLNEQVGDLNSEGARSAARLDRVREERQAWEEARAEAARAGEHGEEWRALQERVDAGETSLRDLVAGRDRSAEAAIVGEWMDTRMAQLRSEVEELAGTEPPGEGVNAVAAATAELLALVRDVRSIKRPMQF